MRRKIKKIELCFDTNQTIEINEEFRVLCVKTNGMDINMWVVVYEDSPMIPLPISLKKTGETVGLLDGYIDTIFLSDEAYHVFANPEKLIPTELVDIF